MVPDSEFVNFELKNGIVLPWLRFTGWLVTCPVLLMFLVSLTTHGGRDAAVPLVPLLVCNLMMLLLGITASACSATYLKWFIFGVACAAATYPCPVPSTAPSPPPPRHLLRLVTPRLHAPTSPPPTPTAPTPTPSAPSAPSAAPSSCCFGGVVFASVLQCFRALDQLVPAAASGAAA